MNNLASLVADIDLSVIKMKVWCLLHGYNICGVFFTGFFYYYYYLLQEAVALTGSAATQPVRVGGVCLHFLHGT